MIAGTFGRLKACAAAAVLAAGVFVPAGTAQAAGDDRPPVLEITVDAQGFTFPGPNPRPAGPVTLKVSTPDQEGRFLGLGQLRNGIGLQEAMGLFWNSQSPDPAVAIPALRRLYRDVEFFGGAGVFPATSPLSVTLNLRPGTYYGMEGATIRELQVTRPYHHVRKPRVDGVIRMVRYGDKTRFVLPARMKAKGSYLVVNQTDQPQEAVFVQVPEGTTTADVQAFLDAERNGQNPPPLLGTQVGGLMAISPGHSAVLEFDFPAATYSMLSFYRNPDTAVKRAYEGMHRVTRLG
ncbi:hypothetical protein [Rhizohabitans arisaemae]|uniref:hypothetical protein n=1 Tax=Rhizohabitans arisaemae TaxID=2720610 RepID=UPI0024B27382|nr:hypothetical protein [Rhizohabitans arisaemae]